MKMGEAIDLIIKEFGAEVAINYRPYKITNPTQRRRKFTATFYNDFPDATPPEFSFRDPLLTVVWERPTEEHDKGRNLLRRTLMQNNVWPTQVNHLWCVPYPDSKATTLEQNAMHRPWLLNAMAAAGSPYVLLMGARPAWTWRPDLRLSKMQGRVGIMRSRHVVMPERSPDIMTRDEAMDWRFNVERFVRIMKEGGDTHHLPNTCVECGAGLYWYDSDGVAWCREHKESGVKAQSKGVVKWEAAMLQANQQTIL